ncbi:group 1 truncated hemoglobin [Paenactinomyces guangxiensis]|uniref:Group 1 truncated hemoglobin n=1 Tax=Paenactinomyces guangxiensis TaxID=1490290 RepID=A0A7W1WN63_9BACL|nr:group 1 truncated hemoglobin [Paenactinomyces guangxiensis]MBA4492969.1 group 1 truncated hemoglobin [Paenactinomyces guangxiensis]MBH8590182.1 group 1 truncated hemoglobin [Paenactinomyces guangxiensis]
MLRSTKSTLYERLGGEQSIAAVINEFYNRMLKDDRVNHHFFGTNMERLRRHQITYFMSYALGGPKKYEGSTLRASHSGLQITSEEYEIAIKHLNSSLRKYNVPLDDIAKIEAFLRSVKPHIINK